MSNNELVMYFLVRNDLGMSKGKIAAQVGHAVQDLCINCPRIVLGEYIKGCHPKIVLKVESLEKLLEIDKTCQQLMIWTEKIIDVGKTEVEPNTITVLGIGPVKKDRVRKILGNLKLL